MKRDVRASLVWSLVVAAVMTTAGTAAAQAVPIEQQKGVRGRVLVAPELVKKTRPLAPEREKLVRGPANVRRWMGRGMVALSEPIPSLVVTIEGAGLKLEVQETPRLVVQGMTISPSYVVVPRPTVIKVENRQEAAITLVSRTGDVILKVAPGETGDASLMPGEHLVSIREMPFAVASVRVLERGRILPYNADGEIPLQDIAGGDYTLAFFLGTELLQKTPISVPEQGFIFIDATVSARKTVAVALKDPSMRLALPPTGVQP